MSISAGDRADSFGVVPAAAGLSGMARRLQAAPARRIIAVTLLALLLAFLSVYPLSMLLYGSLHSTPPGVAGEFKLDGYRAVFTAENSIIAAQYHRHILRQDHPLAVVLAVFLPGFVARTDTPARGTLEVLITLPFFIPPILTAMAWGMLGNTQVGCINLVWQWLTGTNLVADQRLFLRRRGLAHDAVFDAVPVPAHRRCLSGHGPGARGIEPDVRRVALRTFRTITFN